MPDTTPTPIPAPATTDHHLTPHDTHNIYIDAGPITFMWATTDNEEQTGTGTVADPVTDWTVTLTEDAAEPGADGPWQLNHDTVIAAMRTIAQGGTNVRTSIAEAIAAVLAAPTHAHATDELTALDDVGFDAIIQIATLGRFEY